MHSKKQLQRYIIILSLLDFLFKLLQLFFLENSNYCCIFATLFCNMKKRIYRFVLLCVAVVTFAACSKDFDSTAPYQDVTIVYGIIDCTQDIQYVKIYKGFLTNGNAYEAAKVYDSLYYFDKIKVELEEYSNGRLLNTWELDTTTSVPREDGDLASPKQLLYVVNHPINKDNTYKLVITNKETGRVVTAATTVVAPFDITVPSTHTTQSLDISNTTLHYVRVSESDNAFAYNVIQKFYFIEKNKTTGVCTKRCLQRNLTSTPTTATSVGYIPYSLYEYVCQMLTPDENIDRYLLLDSCVCLEVCAVNDDFYKYVQTSTVSSSVVMDHLTYTNVKCEADNRVAGMFGSRTYAYSAYRLNSTSQDLFVRGEASKKLNFHYWNDFEE